MFKKDLCTVCGDCLSWCPYIDIDGEAAKVEFQKLINGEPSGIISQCVSCMGCEEICPEAAYPFSLILKRQEEQNEAARFEKARKNMEGAYRIPTEIKQGIDGKPVIDLCTVSPIIPGLFQGMLYEDSTFLSGGDYFCGIGFFHIGLATPVEKKAAALVDRVARTGAEEIVCYHDDCYTFFSVVAPELGLEVPFRPVSWPEFLYRRLKELEDRIQPLKKIVAYQRPCASRYTPDKDDYVDEIFELVGVDRPGRSHERRQSVCCGGAIVPRDWEMADRIKHQNLEDAHSADAEIMVTLCPLCFVSLRKRAPEHGLTVMPISDLCRAALGEIEIKGVS
jgi:Fe-S oxidoreductase